MNGLHHGLEIYTSSRSERTLPWVKKFLQIHEMDGPHHGLKNLQVHKVNGPHHGLEIYTSSRSGRTPPWVKN